MSDGPVYLRISDAAARLGLAAGTMDKMRSRGGGPPYLRLTPRRIVYTVDALDAWVRSREFNSTSEYQKVTAEKWRKQKAHANGAC